MASVQAVFYRLGRIMCATPTTSRSAPFFIVPLVSFFLFSLAHGADVQGGKAGALTAVKRDLAYTRRTVRAVSYTHLTLPTNREV